MNEQLDQLVSYIKQQFNQGVPEDSLRQLLIQHNYDPKLVDIAFATVKSPTSLPDTQQPLPPQQPESSTLTNQTSPSLSAPQKYRVFKALADAFGAIRNNLGTFLFAVFIVYAVAAGSLFLVSLLTDKLLYGEFGLLFASSSTLLTVLFGSLIVYTAWYAFANAFVLVATSLAIYDGSENRKSSIRTIISNSFARAGRVITANVLFALVSFWPIVLIIFLPIIFIISGHTSGNSSIILMPILMLVAVIWVYIALMRFALAPYVALFEPDVPIKKVLGRSKHLLMKGGQWFLVKGFLLILLLAIVLAVATHQSLPELMNSNSLAMNIVLILVSVIVNGALVMLYHNRKIVRG